VAKKIMREVTQPYHGADGLSVLYGPGDRFPLDADLPADLTTRDVIVDVPDEKPAAAKPAAAKAPAAKSTP
jgi:hypothetical protein